jgi:hypothetical protein
MSDAFDYYPDTDTLIVRFSRAPHNIDIFESANFTVVTGQMGDLVEVEIRDISLFLERLVAEGVPFKADRPRSDGASDGAANGDNNSRARRQSDDDGAS